MLKLMCYYSPAPWVGALSDDARLTSVCLSVTFIGPKSKTEKTKKTKIGTEVGHVTRDSDTTFKVKKVGAYCGGLPHSLFYVVMGIMGFQRHCHAPAAQNSSITVNCVFIYAFLLYPRGSPATFVSVPRDVCFHAHGMLRNPRVPRQPHLGAAVYRRRALINRYWR